jgi:iron complex transport system permease protein
VKRIRILALAAAAALAGAAVSFSGLLGFVGLIVPHMVRRLIGSEARNLLLGCALGGAALLTLCDIAARLLFAPYELPVGIVLSFAGGPFFLWLLIRKRGHQM